MSRHAPAMVNKGTRPERLLKDALRRVLHPSLFEPGQLEEQPSDIPGDLVWRHREVVVFVDGCQWHRCPIHFRAHVGGDPGHGLSREGAGLQHLRDGRIRRALVAQGKRVLAFWEHDIKADADRCARQVAEALRR